MKIATADRREREDIKRKHYNVNDSDREKARNYGNGSD